MNKLILKLLIAAIMFLAAAKPVQAIQAAARKGRIFDPRASHVYQPRVDIYVAGGSAVLKNEIWNLKKPDPRITTLQAYLDSYQSPLAEYAENFITTADMYQLDWKLVPAITGVESTFGKRIPFNSYNAYGWANGTYYFESWEQSINHVSRVLKEKYHDRGLDTPYKIGPVYAPPSKTWAGKVVYFMNQIECYDLEICFNDFTLTI